MCIRDSNMVMLGAYIAATGALKADTLREMIRQMFTGPKAKLVDLNMTALARGMELSLIHIFNCRRYGPVHYPLSAMDRRDRLHHSAGGQAGRQHQEQ